MPGSVGWRRDLGPPLLVNERKWQRQEEEDALPQLLFLYKVLTLFSPSTQMKKVMLTVFKHNHGAYQFFREALQ